MLDRTLRTPVWICAILLICNAIYFARTLLSPLVVAGLVFLALRPLVSGMRGYRVPPAVGATMLLVVFLGVAALSIATVIDPAREWALSLPGQLSHLKAKLEGIKPPVAAIQDASQEVESITQGEDEELGEPLEVQVDQPRWTNQWLMASGTASVGFLMMVVVFSYFLLAGGDALINNVLHVLPSFGDRRRAVELILELQTAISKYLSQVTMINAGLGACVAAAMLLLGMPTPLLWGTMAMLLNYIPFLGAMIGACVIFLAAAIAFEPISAAFLTMAVYVMLTTLEGQFITPMLLGRALRLNTLMVLLSLAFWGWMWGLIGIFVAVPLLIVMRLAFEHFEVTIPLAVVLGGDEQLLEKISAAAEEDSAPQEGAKVLTSETVPSLYQ